MGGLGLGCHGPVLPEKLLLEGLFNLLIESFIIGGVLFSSEDFRDFPGQLRGIGKERRTGQVVWRRSKIASLLGVQGNPVAELNLVIPDIILGISLHEAHPGFHRVIIFRQHILVPKVQVQIPGHNGNHVSPGRRRMRAFLYQPVFRALACQKIRHHMGDSTLFRLIQHRVFQPFPVKGKRIHQIVRRPAENLRVSRPAKALIPLRAVCGHIHEIALHAPENIMVKLLQILS